MFGFGSAVKALFYLIIAIIIAGGLWYVINLKADLAVSEQNNLKLQDGIKQQQLLIESMQKDIEQIQKTNKELQEQNAKQKADTDALAKKFDKRDFGAFVNSNPDVGEKLINRGTTNAMRCLELASGAPLNDKEKSAKNPTEANRECPSLINPAYTSPN